jgi:hypothetical protein
VQLTITVLGDPQGVRSLFGECLKDPSLSIAELRTAAPEDGALSGGLADAITMLIQDDGTAAALASVVIAWIRSRRMRVKATITRPDGASVTFETEGVRGAGIEHLIDEVSKLVSGGVEVQPRGDESTTAIS